MSKLIALIKMQLKDKLDFNFLTSKKETIRELVFTALKFALICVVVYFVLYFIRFIGFFDGSQIVGVIIVTLTIMIVISTISCTIGLMNSLYFSPDNKVLVTLPVSGSVLFLSKLFVFYFYELKKALTSTVPIIVGCIAYAVSIGRISSLVFLWMIIPMILYIGAPVIVGAILSIIGFYIKRIFQLFPVYLYVCICAGIALLAYIVIKIVDLIPSDLEINLINQWGIISTYVREFLYSFQKACPLTTRMTFAMVGSYDKGSMNYYLNTMTFLRVLQFLGISVMLVLVAFFVIRPLFFYMMTKSFEYEKRLSNYYHHNHNKGRYYTFIEKELKLLFRDSSYVSEYLLIYTIVPVLLYLMIRLFKAIDTSPLGDLLANTAIVALMTLPLLASNSKVASLYSKEERAAYIKKTKPIKVYFPLICKLFMNFLLSLGCVIACTILFGTYCKLGTTFVALIGGGILCLQFGHILWSARLDLMNPQNEQYATIGNVIHNPNESKSTVIAFITSFAFAFIFYFILAKDIPYHGYNYDFGAFKIFLVGFVYFGLNLMMYLLSIKGLYYEK